MHLMSESKTFADVIYRVLKCLSLTVYYFQGRLEPSLVEFLMQLHLKGRLLDLLTNIGHGWK
jgi:hypothetical protein